MSALFAATHPERVSSLILYGTFPRIVKAPDFAQGVPGEALDALYELLKQEWGGPVAIDIWAPSVMGDPEYRRWWSRLLRQGTSPAGPIALIELYREIDAREVLSAIDVPVLVFDGPTRAIRCACAIRDELSQIGIEVRAGIHTGEVELIGDDVGGMTVNIGARIGALAAAGEVRVSSTVKELVVGSGLEFAGRGTHTLKGAPGEWDLFAIET